VPFKKWLPFIGKMVEHVGDFHPGKQGNTLRWNDTELGILICYEIIFPDLSRQMVNNGANLLLNITNDAWYGKSSAPYQHFSMAVFRAVENRRTLVRSANTGISGFIDPAGRVMAATALFREAAMSRIVPLLSKTAVYTRIGDLFAQICLAATAMAAVVGIASRRKPK
jgi:apolipoprotein N-acyltransferase